MKDLIKKYPLTVFFVFTFVFSLATMQLGYLSLWGPTIAAVIVSGVLGGWPRVKKLLAGILKWRAKLPWYLFVLFSITVVGLAAVGLYTLVTGKRLELTFFVYPVAFLSGFPEEFGWRGFALPELQKKCSARCGA